MGRNTLNKLGFNYGEDTVHGFSAKAYEQTGLDFAQLDSYLSGLTLEGHRPIVAGGALRDVIFGQKVKDVDIFLSDKTNFEPDSLRPGMCKGWKEISNGEYTELNNNVIRVYKYDRSEYTPYEVIIVKGSPVTHLLNHFDSSLNMIWYSRNSGLNLSSQFQTDLKKREFRIYRETAGFSRRRVLRNKIAAISKATGVEYKSTILDK